MKDVGSRDGHLSSWGLSWATWSGIIYWGLREMVEEVSGGEASLSLWELCEGRAPLLGTLEDRQKRLWIWASLSIGAPMGNLEGGSGNGVSLSEQAQCRGPLGRAPLLETPKDMLNKVLEWVSVSKQATLWGT
jgi:hypothetical protein